MAHVFIFQHCFDSVHFVDLFFSTSVIQYQHVTCEKSKSYLMSNNNHKRIAETISFSALEGQKTYFGLMAFHRMSYS